MKGEISTLAAILTAKMLGMPPSLLKPFDGAKLSILLYLHSNHSTEGRDSCSSAETKPTDLGYGSTSCCLSDRKVRRSGGMALAGGMIFADIWIHFV